MCLERELARRMRIAASAAVAAYLDARGIAMTEKVSAV